MHDNPHRLEQPQEHPGSYASYVTGFLLSVILTLLAYFAVVSSWLEGVGLVALLVVLAVAQLFVQLVFFLHFGRESKPRWSAMSFWFMLTFLLIIVLGSIWIMNNLNYNMMMTTEQMEQHMLKQKDKGF